MLVIHGENATVRSDTGRVRKDPGFFRKKNSAPPARSYVTQK